MDLKEARFRKKMTQVELQTLSQVPQCKISMVENGWITLNDDERERIEKAIGSIDWDRCR